MTYELAKQLRDADFKCDVYTSRLEGDEILALPEPTLSELIAACEIPPDIFVHEIHLSKFAYGNTGYKYEAHVCCQRIKTDICDTPEEAVAKLWLALNKKL